MPTHEYAGPEDRIHQLRPAKMWDQHGRKYAATLEKKTGTPVAQGPRPDGWRAPWIPSQEWFRYGEDEQNPMRFRIDYDGLLADRIASHEGYQAQWDAWASANGWDPKDPEFAGRIIAKVGKRPLPVEPILAAMAGNKYILGLTDKVDTRLLPFLNEKPRYHRAAKLQALKDQADWSFDPDDEMEQRMDVDEDFDRDGVGGQRQKVVPVRPKKSKTPDGAAA